MNRNSMRIAAIVIGSLLLAAPAAARSPIYERWQICPAIDTEPLCDIERPPEPSGAGLAPAFRQLDPAPGDGCNERPWIRPIACPY